MDRRQYLRSGGVVLSGLLGSVGVTTAATGDGSDEVDGRRSRLAGRRATQQGAPPDGSGPIESRYSGTGASVGVPIRIERAGPAVFDVTHSGSGPFAVELLAPDGSQVEVIVDLSGPWSSALAFDIAPGEYELRIDAGGPWSITLVQHPLYELGDFETEFPVELEGSTPVVYGPVDFSEPRTLSFSATGDGRNYLTLYDAAGGTLGVLVNEEGPVETTISVSVAADVAWVGVDTDPGEYTLTIE